MADIIRGLIIAALSTCIISFVLFLFVPLLPFRIFEEYFGLVSIILIFVTSFGVYLVLPSEESTVAIGNDLS